MTRRDFFGISAIAAASICTGAEAAKQVEVNGLVMDASDERDWKQTKIINQKPNLSAKPADTIIYGHIYTAYEDAFLAKAVAIKNGKFVYVGDANGVKEFQGKNTKVLDFKNGVITPGFVDGHMHPTMGMGEKILKLDLGGKTDLDEIRLALKRYVNENPDKKIIQGSGWDDAMLGNDEPTAAMIDDITDKPVVLSAVSHHKDWLNSAALKLAGIDKNFPDIKGGVIVRDKDGNPLGVVKEDASLLSPTTSPVVKIIPPLSDEEMKKVILSTQDYLFARGITCFLDAGINLSGGDRWIEMFRKLDNEGKLKIHAYACYLIKDTPNALQEVEKVANLAKQKGKNFHITNIKIFLDGVIEAGTAYLNEPYNNNPKNKGEILWDKGNLTKLIAKANELGISVHFHSIGDASTTFALDAIEEAQKISKAKDPRNAITHLQLVDPKDFARMAKLGVIAVTDPYWHVVNSPDFEASVTEAIGEERRVAQYPLKSFFEAGVITSCASDFPATLEPNVMEAMQAAVTRSIDEINQLNPKEVVNIGEIFWATTINGAYQLKAEKQIGSIEVGKDADLVMLDANMEKMELTKLNTIKVLKTMVAGDMVYERKERAVKQGAMFF